MKKLIFLLFLLIIPINVYAIDLNSKSIIAMDVDSSRVFYEKNADEKRLIASTTKIMTAILAIESGKLDNIVTVGEEVLDIYGSNIYISYKEKMLLIDLVYGLMLRSGNDAAIVIASYIGGTEEKFVQMMNKKAQELGMVNTIFQNSHGLDENTKNISTARDMAILTSYAAKNKTYLKISSTKSYICESDIKTYSWRNRNKLLFSYNYITSGKTGSTPSAGKVLSTTASNNNLNIAIFSFNYGYDYDLHKVLFEDIFNDYKKYPIVDKNKFSIDYNSQKLYVKNSFFYPLKEKEIDKITTKVVLSKTANKNKKIGEMYIYLEDNFLHKESIYINENISIWRKIINKFLKE